MHQPSGTYWITLKSILQYFERTLNHGLLIRKYSSLYLHVLIDVDWIDNTNDKTSISTYIIILGANLINRSSKKQNTIARYIMKAT